MREPKLVVLSRHKFVFEAKGKISIDTFASAIIIIQKGVIIIEVIFDLFRLFLLPLYIILRIADLLAAPEPPGAIRLIFPLRPNAGLHSNLVKTGRFRQI